MSESKLIADSSEWTFPMIERYNEVIGQIAVNDFGLDTLSQPDRDHYRRTDDGRLFLGGHAARL